jgi:hypothetical protein
MSYRRFVGERDWNFPVNDLDSADRCDPNLGSGGLSVLSITAASVWPS